MKVRTEPLTPGQRSVGGASVMQKLTKLCVNMVEKVMPDPFVIAVLLTIVTIALAFLYAPKNSVSIVLDGWFKGAFDITSFAFLIAFTLITGHALTTAKPVATILRWMASLPKTELGAMALAFYISLVAGYLNWACGLVISALFAREVAKRVRIDFGWLLAAAYSGWSFFALGISSSVALVSATKGEPLNIIEKVTGSVVPMRDYLLSPLNWLPIVILSVAIPILFWAMKPEKNDVIPADAEKLKCEDSIELKGHIATTLAAKLNKSWLITILVSAIGVGYIINSLLAGTFKLDLKLLVIIFFLLGLLLHWRPESYINAIEKAARISGPIILQFPLYGGIMGVMTATGLATMMAQNMLAFSTPGTLSFWTFISSIVISLFVPSAGGHWAVQAPFVVEAAAHLGVSQSAIAIAVALGEGAADLIQPMWLIPLLSIAGISLSRVMGYTIITFLLMVVVMSGVLLFIPH